MRGPSSDRQTRQKSGTPQVVDESPGIQRKMNRNDRGTSAPGPDPQSGRGRDARHQDIGQSGPSSTLCTAARARPGRFIRDPSAVIRSSPIKVCRKSRNPEDRPHVSRVVKTKKIGRLTVSGAGIPLCRSAVLGAEMTSRTENVSTPPRHGLILLSSLLDDVRPRIVRDSPNFVRDSEAAGQTTRAELAADRLRGCVVGSRGADEGASNRRRRENGGRRASA